MQNPKEENCSLDTSLLPKMSLQEKETYFLPNTMMTMLAFSILPPNCQIAPFLEPDDGIGKFE